MYTKPLPDHSTVINHEKIQDASKDGDTSRRRPGQNTLFLLAFLDKGTTYLLRGMNINRCSTEPDVRIGQNHPS
jgi:hypothetical protein